MLFMLWFKRYGKPSPTPPPPAPPPFCPPAEVEAALQGVTEAQGCLSNQQAAVARQLAAAASPPAAAIDWASPQEALLAEEERQLARANLEVLRQLLEQQQRHAEECRQKLQRWAQAGEAGDAGKAPMGSGRRFMHGISRRSLCGSGHGSFGWEGALNREHGAAAAELKVWLTRPAMSCACTPGQGFTLHAAGTAPMQGARAGT